MSLGDRALRIFTSGTTGFPKAAEVSHRKVVTWTHWFAGLAGLSDEDRLYNCLPMHHSVGGVVAIGAPLVGGGAAAIAPKFSTSRFWDDVARWECTAFQYIGELCRYLDGRADPYPRAARQAQARARQRPFAPSVWTAFAERFPAGARAGVLRLDGRQCLALQRRGQALARSADCRPSRRQIAGRARPVRRRDASAGARRRTASASRATKAKRWGASPATRPRASRATATRRRPRRRCCATCLSPATPGCAPAT